MSKPNSEISTATLQDFCHVEGNHHPLREDLKSVIGPSPLVADVSPVPTTPLDDIQELSEGASPTNLPMPGAEMLFDAPSHAETSTGANDSDDAKNQMLKRS